MPDSQTVQTTYNGNSVTATDQVNRKIQRMVRHPTVNAIAIQGPGGAIFLGPNWFADSRAGQARTLIHEAIHLIGGKRDQDFDPGRDKDTGSDNLRKILAEKCKLK